MPDADAGALLRVLEAVGKMVSDLDDPSLEIDLNPVFVLPVRQGTRIVDMRVVTRSA